MTLYVTQRLAGSINFLSDFTIETTTYAVLPIIYAARCPVIYRCTFSGGNPTGNEDDVILLSEGRSIVDASYISALESALSTKFSISASDLRLFGENVLVVGDTYDALNAKLSEWVRYFPSNYYDSETTYTVTNLNDSGAGSFRNAIEQSGKKRIVFDSELSGTITPTATYTINDGTVIDFTTAGGAINFDWTGIQDGATFDIRGDNVKVFGLINRPGATPLPSSTRTALRIWQANNVEIANCSLFWGVDGIVDVPGECSLVTIRDCILAECLVDSNHPDGLHSMAITLGTFGNALSDKTTYVTILRNYIVHNRARGLRQGCIGAVRAINNIWYNQWQLVSLAGDRSTNIGYCDLIHNVVKDGNSNQEPTTKYYLLARDRSQADKPFRVYVNGNTTPYPSLLSPNSTRSFLLGFERNANWSYPFTIRSIANTETYVLANAGSPVRDSHDTRVINDYTNNTGQWVDVPPT